MKLCPCKLLLAFAAALLLARLAGLWLIGADGHIYWRTRRETGPDANGVGAPALYRRLPSGGEYTPTISWDGHSAPLMQYVAA